MMTLLNVKLANVIVAIMGWATVDHDCISP